MRAAAAILLAAGMGGAAAGPTGAANPLGDAFTAVGFPSAGRPAQVALTAYLERPADGARHPAIVALHGCGGIAAPVGRYLDWASRLVAAGYVVLFPDSFGPRGFVSQCGNETPADQRVDGVVRADDALGAAAWLKAQPFVDPARIGALGWSHGGITGLSLAGRVQAAGTYQAVVAFYPDCRDFLRSARWRPQVPLQILMGAADDWTPAEPCRQLAAKFPAIALTVFPGTYHDFDVPSERVHVLHDMRGSTNADKTVHVGTNPAARAAAIPAAMDFLAARLAPAERSP